MEITMQETGLMDGMFLMSSGLVKYVVKQGTQFSIPFISNVEICVRAESIVCAIKAILDNYQQQIASSR
jgi:hypothetical protein